LPGGSLARDLADLKMEELPRNIYILWLKKDLTYIKATTSISSLGSAA
jgi:hypothetical protein